MRGATDVASEEGGSIAAKKGSQHIGSEAIDAAKAAQPAWAATNPQRRARVMMAFGALINQNISGRRWSSEFKEPALTAMVVRALRQVFEGNPQ